MFFSRVRLRGGAREKKEYGDLADNGYLLHSRVWDLFADAPDRKRDFIYRQDPAPGFPLIFCVSDRMPNDRNEIWQVESKPYAPVVGTGQRFAFVLRANPIRAKRDENHRQHRHDVVMELKTRLREKTGALPRGSGITEQAGYEWLAQKGRSNGFGVRAGEVRIDGYRMQRFRKTGEDREIRISTLDFSGLLTVTEPDLFVRALFSGIGPAKGFGCGMLMIRRV